jgi:hypothetical protein
MKALTIVNKLLMRKIPKFKKATPHTIGDFVVKHQKHSLLPIMMKIAAFSLVSASLAAPDLGCFYVKLPFPAPINVEAQIEIKSGSVLDFDVVMDIPNPRIKLNSKCAGEQFSFDAAASTITVGQEPLSECLSTLKQLTNGVVQTPVVINYTPQTLSTRIVIPITMNKVDQCVALNTPTNTPVTTVAPTTSATNTEGTATTEVPTSTMTQTGAAAAATTTTGSSAASLAMGSVIAAVLVAML